MNFYFEAAKVLDRLDAKQGSVKGLIATLPEKDRRRSAALIIETLKFKSVLCDVINASKLMKEERKLTSLNLALLLIHDLLLSRGIQTGDGPIKQAILRHKTRLHGEFQKIKIKRGVVSNAELAQVADERSVNIPRYVRVNTALWTTQDAVQTYLAKGFTLTNPFESSRGFLQDEHIPNLLLFPSDTSFLDDPAYISGKVILQDKASCFPAEVLSPPTNGECVVIDATAAPGNKTTHLSALMGNRGTLFAFERDRKRFSTLQMMVAKAGCRNVVPMNIDFLNIEPHDAKYCAATHILLDPSCSGSGIINRLDHLLETESEDQIVQAGRLNKLAAFQLMMIRHAMKFPNVEKIVYSTCSIHATENEHVVRSALKSDEAKEGLFSLALPNEVLPKWPRRGLLTEMDSEDHAASLIRCSPGEDGTNGFFVSCFVKSQISQKRKATSPSPQDQEISKPSKRQKRKKRNLTSAQDSRLAISDE